MSIVTLADAKANLSITVSSYDTRLQGFVDAADPVIEDITGPINVATVTETFNGGRQSVVLKSKASAITSVTMNGKALSANDYTADLDSGIVYRGSPSVPLTFTPGRQNVVVVYTVGDATAPANAVLAALELIRFWWQQGQQVNYPGLNTLPSDGETFTPSGFAVPKRVIELCAPNMRRPGIA